MISLLPLTYLLVWLFSIHGTNGEDWPVLNASLVPPEKRNYNIRDNYCRLLAHTSALLRDPRSGHLTIVLDGGMAKYKVQVERTRSNEFNESIPESNWEVPDLNGHTAIIDLSVDFTLSNLQDHMQLIPKPKINNAYVPVVNRGYMWVDSNSNIYTSGGHFFEQEYWSESAYYVKKQDIPDFSIWRYSIDQSKWTEVFLDSSGDPMIRLISSASTSIPGTNLSYAFGGYLSPRSGRNNIKPPTSPGDWATNGLVIYDHGKHRARNISQPQDLSGYTHGALHHIGPFENHKGLLLVLMAREYPLNFDFTESDPKQGKSFDFTKIRFYNLETNEWYTQRADFMSDQKPTARTRFCSVLVREEGTQTWDLWLYGGQGTVDVDTHPNDIWVLTMPAFMWVKVTHSMENVLTRGHTCHAVGSQMITLGGYPPSMLVDPKAPCDSTMIRVFDMTQKSWNGDFKATSTYKQPKGNDGLERWRTSQPLQGWGDPVLQSLMNQTVITPTTPPPPPTTPPPPSPNPTPKSQLELPVIIGASVGGLIGLLLTGAFIYWCFRVYVPKKQGENEDERSRRQNSITFSGSMMSGPGDHEHRVYSKPELDGGTDSGSIARPPYQRSPAVEVRHPAPWEASDLLGPLHTPRPATPIAPPEVSPASTDPPSQSTTPAPALFPEMGRGENTAPGNAWQKKRPSTII